eukprot:3632167-Rhodomonas_salina.1
MHCFRGADSVAARARVDRGGAGADARRGAGGVGDAEPAQRCARGTVDVQNPCTVAFAVLQNPHTRSAVLE